MEKGKALLIPINLQKEIFIQDRRGFKKPDWGFFGGGIENGETALQAVIREAKEELDIDLIEEELIFLGEISMQWDQNKIPRFFFLYKTKQQNFTVLEGAGGYWMNFEKAKIILDNKERFDIITSIIIEKL